MKKIFNFTKKKKHGTPDNGSVLSAGYDLKDKDLGKIHKAALQGDLAKLRQLVRKNDINQLDKDNRTALHIACASGHVEVVQFLIENKAKLNLCDNQNRSALMKAVQGQHERCVSILLENHAEPNVVDINGNTALHLAANIPSISAAVLLLQHGAEIDAQNKEGFTPLAVAVREDHIEMAEFLLKESADVNSVDQDQRSLLMLAAGNGQISMVKLLLHFDADVTLKDAKGLLADNYAAMNCHHPCSLLIIEHGTQKTNSASASHRGQKTKKRATLASSSHDVEAGFSLGGPATDKEDFEDNSQSESLSRLSKSAGDEWPSSEEEDESALVDKRGLKVNLSEMIESKKGKASVLLESSSSETESKPKPDSRIQKDPALPAAFTLSKPSQPPVDLPSASSLPKEPQMCSTPLPASRKKKRQHSSSQEDSSVGENSEEEEDEEEEEEEEEEDEEEDEEEEDEESEEEEENEEDDPVDDKVKEAAVVQGDPSTTEVQTASVSGVLDVCLSPEPSGGAQHEVDDGKKAKTDAEDTDLLGLGRTSVPATLSVVGDCIVSAIRVESKFSDEDESPGKDILRLTGQSINPEGPLLRHVAESQFPHEAEDEESERDVENDSQNSQDKSWNASEREEQTKPEGLMSSLIAFQRNLLEKVDKEITSNPSDEEDVQSDQGREEKQKSSWGSSSECSDADLPNESEGKAELKTEAAQVQPQILSLLSTPPVDPTKDQLSHSSPRSTNRHVVDGPDGSEWDSSENYVSSVVKPQAVSQDSNVVTFKQTKERSSADDESLEKEPDDPSPVVSGAPEDDETTRNQVLDEEDAEMEEKSHSGGEKEDSWDEEEESLSNLNKLPSGQVELTGETEGYGAEGCEGNQVLAPSVCVRKDGSAADVKFQEWSEDSDSEHHILHNHFGGASFEAPCDRKDPPPSTDGCTDPPAKLTAFIPLKFKGAELSADEGETGRHWFSSHPSCDVDTNGSENDEVLPQTDIDDVDLDSPGEADISEAHQIRNINQTGIQRDNPSEDEDDTDKDKGGDEEEDVEDISEEEPRGDGGGPKATTALPEEEEFKEKKRDFLSELGLEKDEEEEDSWDSESHSENSNTPHKEEQRSQALNQETSSTGAQEPGNSSHGKNVEETLDEDVPKQKGNGRANWEPLNVLRKLEIDQKKDLMEELGLGEFDDFEDSSDWDSTSTASKTPLSARGMASAGPRDPGASSPAPDDSVPAAEMTPQRSSEKRLPNTPSKSGPQPQPRARKRLLLKPESDQESDWESDKGTSSSQASSPDRNKDQPVTAVKHSSSEDEEKTIDTKANREFRENLQKDKDDADDRLELDRKGVDGDDSCTVEGVANIPWEKRYEKLWVEVEKKEVKSTFKSVAGELKERFGELFKSRRPSEKTKAEETSPSSSAEEESSDEDDVIVHPAARARSSVLFTIPEQRESGQEDSAAEHPDSQSGEENLEGGEEPGGDGSGHGGSDLLSAAAPNSASLLLTTTEKESEDGFKSFNDKSQSEENRSPDGTDHRAEELQERRHSELDPGASEELKGSMGSWKLQTGNGLPLSRGKETKFKTEADTEKVLAKAKLQESNASCEADGKSSELKPESLDLSNEAGEADEEQHPVAPSSTSLAPLQMHIPVQQAVDAALRQELVGGARHSRAPQTSVRVNGNPLSVFDDSSLSEESDEERRLQSAEQQQSKNPEEMEMAEDFDELTQSSDTATDDIDSSGYHHASLLVQKLDSATLDPTSIAKLQNIFHEYERSIQKVRSRHGYLSDKVNQLDAERAELKNSLEEVKDAKSALERNQLELQTEVTNLKFQLKQEQENRRNAEIMYNTTRDKLRRTEEQHQLDLQDKQQVELTLRNLELEMRTLISNMKRLEEEHSETQRLLTQERSARTLQENLLNGHLRRQQEMEEENKRSMSRSTEALSQLTEASDRERELLQQISALQAQLTVLRTDLDSSQSSGNLRENQLQEENEALKEKLEDVQRDLKLSNEAVTQTIYSCNNQLTVLKSELTKTANRLESERQVRESLEAEVESTRSRLTGALKEVDLRLAAHSEAEKALLREKEEHQRLKDKLKGEAASQREAVGSLSQKLAKAEAHENSLENELHRVTLQLTEKGLLLDVLQREKEQAAARVKELEAALQAERESGSRAAARQEAAQERLAQAQSDAMLLRQQLEEAQNKGSAKERAVTDAQERFSDILSKLRSDCEERVQLVEDRNKELASKAADLCDKIYKLEEERSDRETSLRQLQQELADSLKKLSMSEASLEVNTRYRSDLEEEKTRLLRDLDRLKAKLEESEDQFVQAERRVHHLKSSLNEKEQELSTTAQKLQEALYSSAATALTIKQLEEALQKLEIENAKLEAAAKQQTSKIEALQKEAEEAVKVRGHLEGLVTNLQTSKMTLEEQLSKEVQKQSLMSHTAQDSQALWEEELKSRSKLGLRLAELEKEKGELSAQMEVEKKKVKKVSEQKKAVDTRLDQEMKRNAELQKEMYRLRTLLKTAKKKLRDQEVGAAELLSPSSSLRMEHGRHSQTDGRMQDRVEDLQAELQREASRCNQLEGMNGELKNQVKSLRSTSHHSEQLERSKHQLEEEVLDLRRRMEATQAEHSQVEQLRRDAEERIRQEVQHKLEQVNLFLQTHAASQEALDQIRAANEASLRSQLEQKIRELEVELGRARNSQQDSLTQRDSTRSELERFKQLHSEELRLRKSLSAKLDRANSRLAEANSKLLSERSRSLISSNMANGSLLGPPLDLSSLASPANYGQLNRNAASLGLSLLNPAPDGQRSGVDDYLAKMLGELDRSICKELGKANTELDAACTRMSSVGSASRGELDPLSRATQEYLEVLKKNRSL